MNRHKHARLTAKGRALLVSRVLEQGWTVTEASQAAGVSERTAYPTALIEGARRVSRPCGVHFSEGADPD